MTICQYLTNWQLNKTCKLSILYMYRKEVLIMETDYYRQVIKEYRKSQKLSQEKFAELLDCDTTYISRTEKRKKRSQHRLLHKIFKFIGNIF